MDDPVAVEHPQLLQSASAILSHLSEAGSHLEHGPEIYHHQHGQFAERVRSLHQYLFAALHLTHSGLYMPAFVVLRSALEHHVQDHLLFLGDRYRAVVKDVTDETLEDWQQAIRQRRPDFAAVLRVQRAKGNRVEVTRSGPHFTDGEQGLGAPGLSIYYPVIFDDFDPFTGGKSAQDFIGTWPFQAEGRRKWAARAADLWGYFLRWNQLKANLLLNEFYTERELARWEVHFSFLSAFTHPTVKGLEAIYGHNYPNAFGYDHYASELALLYVVTIARLELEVFEQMTQREPKVNLRDWERVRVDMSLGELFGAHLWFPRGRPPQYDRVEEANRRGMDNDWRLIPRDERLAPNDLADDDIPYYANPLKRLIGLHAGINEMTGFSLASDWPRQDAWFRR